MKPLKIGIIDSGIDLENTQLMKYVKKAVYISNNGHVDKSANDEIGHGTAVADLITRRMGIDDVELYVYKIFSQEDNVEIEHLKAALQQAINDKINLLNCSLGTIDPSAKYKLESTVKQSIAEGMIIISAWNDEDYTAWPANFGGVISVKSGEQKNQSEWYWEKNKRNHVVFRGTKQRIKWKDNSQLFIGGSSFAAALCTNNIANEIVKHDLIYNLHDIEKYLEKNAVKRIEVDLERSTLIRWNNFHNNIKKAGLYPFFKEMHGFVRFRNNLNYEIGWISDFNASKNVNKSTKEVLENCDEDILIKPGLPNDHEDIDTLIIGYLDKASEAQRKDLLLSAIEYAYQRKLNVFSFLPPVNYPQWKNKFQDKGLWLEVPIIDFEYAKKIIEEVPEKKAFDTPILGVFGTSSQQGKFTLQLALRYELQKRGYKIAQIGTEHQSGCFGINFTFPNGYGATSSIPIPMDFHLPILRKVISTLDNGDRDLILVGGQSGLLNPDPYYYNNIYSELFYIGVLPDVSILLTNRFDEKELIEQTKMLMKIRTRNNGKILTIENTDITADNNKFGSVINTIIDNIS
ncbi:MAG: S8 family serine peptidase [Bacteroidota bacterium]